MEGAGESLTKSVSVPMAAAGTAAIKFASESQDAYKQFAAATGTATENLGKYQDMINNVYKDNFGESIGDVADAMAKVDQNMSYLDDSALQRCTEYAYTLADTFDVDIGESTRAADSLIKNFGVSAREAFNLMAQGAQNGLDFSGELFDNVDEYSVQFQKLGLDAEDMFSIFANGAENGAFNLDKIGDAVKEFSIRAIDGSDTTKQGFELSLIDWENPIHNISVGIVSNAIEAEHSKTSDKALVADRVLSVDVNGLVNYSSRNLLDVNNCSVGLLSRGIVGENNGYITSNFMPVNDFVAYCNEGKTDIPINAIAFYTDAKENSYIPDSQITVWSGAPSGYAKSDMPDDAKYFRVSVYKDYITGSAYKYQMFEKGTAKTHWQAYFNSYKSSENQVLFDKVIDTLGDSITEQRTWQGYVADALHTGVIYNHGIGGTRISGNDSNAMWQDSRINALNDDIDCLLIMGGTNDGAQGVTIGDMSRDNVNTDTFVGAYNVLLSKVFYKYYRLGSGYSGITQISEVNPIQIMIATPIYCNDSNYGNMDEIAEAVRGVANLWSIPVADQHAKSGINSATSSIYLSDNVHPNDEGGKKVANVWVNALKSNAELIN